MPTPSIRNPIRPARGNHSDLVANVADLHEGELCYAVDRDLLYVVEGGSLQPVNQVSVPGSDPLTTNVNGAQPGESLNYNGSQWINGGPQDGGNF
jgi:hypothetical protein